MQALVTLHGAEAVSSNFILLIVPRRYFCCGSICFMFWSRFLCTFSYFYLSSGN